jgi:NSS family neurotransmitter:Na+ symporter
MAKERGQWGSRIGFILAAAGAAVGLGNVWKFPYITGENGGGAFVLVYLLCIAVIGLPIMIAEVMLGRMAKASNVTAFKTLAGDKTPWQGVGWLGVAIAFVVLSYYSVVAGWSMHYTYLAATGSFTPENAAGVPEVFTSVIADPQINLFWHVVFMAITTSVVVAGVQGGVERAARVLMPALLVMLTGLLIYATTLDGFGAAVDFVFGFRFDKLTKAGILEALGHSFFTLSVGMGAMLTYGSYLKKEDDAISASIAITILDTLVALMACLILFPITFSKGMEPAGGPGLVFVNIPSALSELPGGSFLSVVFFLLLFFAALTSAVSLLEVAGSFLIDEKGWSRKKAMLTIGGAIFLFGIPSALSNVPENAFGAHFIGERNWFDSVDYLASNWGLPLGGMGIALFAAWGLGGEARRVAFSEGSKLGKSDMAFAGWLVILRYLVPIGIGAVIYQTLAG